MVKVNLVGVGRYGTLIFGVDLSIYCDRAEGNNLKNTTFERRITPHPPGVLRRQCAIMFYQPVRHGRMSSRPKRVLE